MGYKLIRIILILIVALAAATVLPRYFNMMFSSGSSYVKIDYSELLNDFIITDYNTESINGKQTPILRNRDRKGNEYTSVEADSLMPSSRVEQLLYIKKFPDSINGISVTAKMMSEANYTLYNVNFRSYDYGLYDLRDRESSVSKEWETVDLLRLRKDHAEFIVSQSKTIDYPKSEKLTNMLNEYNFVWPYQQIFKPNAQNIIESIGYFITDQKNNLFRLSMDKTKPIVEEIAFKEDEIIQSVYFTDRADFLALITTDNGNLYKMQANFSYSKLPLPSISDKNITMKANFFHRMFILSDSEYTEYYILDNTYQLIDQFKLKEVKKEHKYRSITEYIFPFEIWQTPWDGFRFQWNSISQFVWLNLLLTAIIIFINKKKKSNLFSVNSVTNIFIVLFTGIYGFIAVLLLSEKKLYK